MDGTHRWLFGGGFRTCLFQAASCYYLPAFLLHFVVPRCTSIRSIRTREERNKVAWRDAKRSFFPVIVKAMVWTCVERIHEMGWGKLREGRIPWIQSLFAWIALDLLHDTWFYWVHRFLHWRPLYKHVHYVHHESRMPNAFTGYSFHVLEAMIVFLNEIAVIFLFPMHVEVHRAYHMFTTLVHIGGHVGYEIAPYIPTIEQFLSWICIGPKLCGYLNTVLHHDMHHQYPSKHFSLYFTHWDVLMSTMHPSYETECLKFHENGRTTEKDSVTEASATEASIPVVPVGSNATDGLSGALSEEEHEVQGRCDPNGSLAIPEDASLLATK